MNISAHATRLTTVAICFLFGVLALEAQTPVPVGAGSFASAVPASEYFTDSYYGLPAAQVEPVSPGTAAFFNLLHLDPSLQGTPIPTNHWWTDLLIANRSSLPSGSSQYVLKQDPYGGNMWFFPGMLKPQSYGIDVYFPNSWLAPNANGTPQGGFDKGPALPVHGNSAYNIPAADVLIADFETGYPPGTVNTGSAFAATPSTGNGLIGMMGNYCASTRDGGNGLTGHLELPNFQIQKQYLHFLICGGSTATTQVRLIVNGVTVLAASGTNSTTFAWTSWDISAWKGQIAHVEIADESTGSWGFISCDQIVESDSANPVGRFGGDLVATQSVVTNWGDWNVDFKLPDAYGREADVTMARGVPFTWTTWTGMHPRIIVSGATLYDKNNAAIIPVGGQFTADAFSFNYQGRTYGIFLPDNTTVVVGSTYLEPQLAGSNNYMVVGYLPATTNLAEFAAVAFARPTNTELGWSYNAQAGMVNTTWNLTTVPLKGSNLNTIQGWLPHHYRTTTSSLAFASCTYLTPRGIMKCSTGNAFTIGFPFKGIPPVLPAPKATGLTNDFQPARMTSYLNAFNPGTMLGDTYWSGKAMGLCAEYMVRAQQLGDTADFLRLQGALNTAMTNWLTYTPGESVGFFAPYPNWHAFIGFDASYGTQAFNDLHFHYGYFATAAARLGMTNPQFLTDYHDILEMIVKCYGNWDRTDTSEPFLRTFDIWEGHSNAGGMSSSNGENQESSSEAMQSWAGMFLLGQMMNDQGMAQAGAMGFAMESCAVNEYWQDIYKTNFPPGYTRAGNGILGASSYAYGTYFSGDPAWVYGIQYTPANLWNNYLMRYQPGTVSAKYQAMWSERANWCANYPAWSSTIAYAPGTWVSYLQKVYSVKGTNTVPAGNPSPDLDSTDWTQQADCTASEPNVLGGGLGHVILCYQALWDHDNAAAEFDRYFSANQSIATNTSDAGSTYYLIHAQRQLGDQDYTGTTSIPTSAVYLNASTGVRTYVVYNPAAITQSATVYANGAPVGTITVPAQTLVSTTNPNYNPTAPLAPTGFHAVLSSGAVALSWNPSDTASSYNVMRAFTSGGPYQVIGTPTAASVVDSSVTAGSNYFYVVSAVNSLGESPNSAEQSIFVPGGPTMAVNCGGPAIAPFGADSGATGGSTSTTSTAPDLSGVTNPAPAAVYQSYRFGAFTYTLTGLNPTTNYSLRLHFSETYWTAAGKRLFNVVLNGTTVLTNFDIFAATGAKNKAIIQQFNCVSNASGQITLQFVKGTDNPLCCGIDLAQPAPPAPNPVSASLVNDQPALSWAAASGATGYLVKRSASSNGPYATIGLASSTNFSDAGAPAGINYYVVSAVNQSAESANSASVTVTVLSPLQNWRMVNFGTSNPNDPVGGDNATPLGDGVPNLLKYALGLSPKQNGTGGLPSSDIINDYLTLSFSRQKIATDITYHVEASGDLASWNEIWSSANVPYGGGTNPSQAVTVSDIVPIDSPNLTGRFLRLRVTSP